MFCMARFPERAWFFLSSAVASRSVLALLGRVDAGVDVVIDEYVNQISVYANRCPESCQSSW